MDRLIQTSAGWVVIDIDEQRWSGRSVTATPFESDGWEREGKLWAEKYGYHEPGERLPEFLELALGIPADEAEALAKAIEGPWHDDWVKRGGRVHSRELETWAIIIMAVLALGAALAVTGFILIVWLLLT